MGAGASSLSRLRKSLLLRTYNVKAPTQTVEEKFKSFATKSCNGKLVLTPAAIHEALDLDNCSWLASMLSAFVGNHVTELDFREFIEFLESGKAMSFSESLPEPQNMEKIKSPKHRNVGTLMTSKSEPGLIKRGLDPSLQATSSTGEKLGTSINIGKPTDETGEGHNPPLPPLSIKESSESGSLRSDLSAESVSSTGVKVLSFDNNQPKEISMALVRKAGSSLNSPLKKYETVLKPSQPIWQKREIVKQERTVTYITIDEDGERQELFESETHQTEILHMESRITGEFAHRETTYFDARELFNNEVVNEERGEEEYVHMKSLEDEYEFMESTLPKKAQKESSGGAGESDAKDGRLHEPTDGAGPSPFSPIVNDDYNFTEAREMREAGREDLDNDGYCKDDSDNDDLDRDQQLPQFDTRKLNKEGEWRAPNHLSAHDDNNDLYNDDDNIDERLRMERAQNVGQVSFENNKDDEDFEEIFKSLTSDEKKAFLFGGHVPTSSTIQPSEGEGARLEVDADVSASEQVQGQASPIPMTAQQISNLRRAAREKERLLRRQGESEADQEEDPNEVSID